MGSDATPSARQRELLDAAYAYVLVHGLSDLSLRPLAAAIGSSPRVLIFLYGSKDGLVRALLERARADELTLLDALGEPGGSAAPIGLGPAVERTWTWLAAAEHRGLLRLWAEAYARSLTETDGPWAGFARGTVADWLAVLAGCQSPAERDTDAGLVRRTLALAVLRGALLDLLATGDEDRAGGAVAAYLAG
ncbi:TetR/AcrR family transcriptional regulator [Nocardioides humi]|uniref:TetR family transcriptional regulator n=1 Tax=Nocardioides humi TaxID=449461 RepID=A0ABN2AKU8_9ACTN|nr:TetR/AcrR family transcriptional regulator [Nocardioides humi]